MLGTIDKAYYKLCKTFNEKRLVMLIKKLIYRIKNRKRLKADREHRRKKRNDRKREKIISLGRKRYILSQLFGHWINYYIK